MLAIPFSLPRTFGRMVGDNRQGYAIARGDGQHLRRLAHRARRARVARRSGTAPQLAGGAMEGKEQRFGILASTLFATSTTLTSTGAVNSMHDSLHVARRHDADAQHDARRGRARRRRARASTACWCSPSSPCSSPACWSGARRSTSGKKIGPREIKLASLYILVTPTLVLAGHGAELRDPGGRDRTSRRTSIWNPGLHGLTEVLYAFTSAANNNGSAFAGLTANTPWLNTALGVAMLLGRFVPIVLVLALAGSLAAQDRCPSTAGTLPTHRPQFVGLLIGRRRHRHRTHLLPGPRARTPRGRAA